MWKRLPVCLKVMESGTKDTAARIQSQYINKKSGPCISPHHISLNISLKRKGGISICLALLQSFGVDWLWLAGVKVEI